MKSMNREIGFGVLWNLASLLISRGAGTLITLFLARLLAPEVFGLIAMATIVFELSSAFIQSGLGQALIRSKTVSQADLDTVFYTNLGLSLIAYAALFSAAPFIADFYRQPDLTAVIRIMGISVLINASRVVQNAILARKMSFKVQMKANTSAVFASGILAVVAAFNGWGVWSLVLQMLSSSLIASFILWFASDWRPTLQYSTESFKRLFGFGRNLLAEGLLAVLYQNSYYLVIGRFFSAELTGLYFFAKKMSNLVSHQLTSAVQQTTLPALSKIQDNNELLLHKYRLIIQFMMLIIAPVMLALAAYSQPLFDLLLPERWQGAVPYMQMLCFIGVMYPLNALNLNILNVKGRSDLIFKLGLIKKAFNLALLFMAIPYGVSGIIASQMIGSVFALIPNTYYSAQLVNYGLKAQLSDIFKPLMSAVIPFGMAYVFINTTGLNLLWQLASAVIPCLLYVLLCYIANIEGFRLLLGKLKKIIDKKRLK